MPANTGRVRKILTLENVIGVPLSRSRFHIYISTITYEPFGRELVTTHIAVIGRPWTKRMTKTKSYEEQGKIKDSGQRRKTPSGRNAIVWVATRPNHVS